MPIYPFVIHTHRFGSEQKLITWSQHTVLYVYVQMTWHRKNVCRQNEIVHHDIDLDFGYAIYFVGAFVT